MKESLINMIKGTIITWTGIAGNIAIKWWTSLDKEQIGRVINGLKIAGIAVGGILGFQLGKAVFGVGKALVGAAKAPFVATRKTFRRGIKRSNVRRQIRKDKLLNKKTKFNRTGLGGKKKGFFNFGKNKKVVTATKDLGEQTAKQGLKKTVTKTTVKVGAKRLAAGSLPVIGAIIDGYAGFERLAKGDKTSAGLFFEYAASSFLKIKGHLYQTINSSF